MLGGLNTRKLIIIALGYFGLGQLSLLMAVPPGFSSPVFPAAGFAIAMLLLYGRKMVLGIFLGSLLLNYTAMFTSNESFSQLGRVLHPLIIAIGSSIQFFISHYFLEYSLKKPKAPVELNQILKFLLIAGPIACLISATISSFSAFIFNIVGADILFSNWFSWYIGDTLGVLVFAPGFLILSGKTFRQSLFDKAVFLTPLVISFTSVLVLHFYLSQMETLELRKTFVSINERVAARIQRTANDYSLALKSFKAFFEASDTVTKEEFISYGENQIFSTKGIHSLFWLPKKGDIENLEVQYSVPESVRVFDRLELEKIVYASKNEIKKMCRYNRLSDSIIRDIEGEGQLFIRIAPVIDYDMAFDFEKCKHVQGYLVGVFLTERVIRQALSGLINDELKVFVESFDKHKNRLLYSNSGLKESDVANVVGIHSGNIHHQTDIEFFGQKWRVVSYISLHTLSANRTFTNWTVLIMGMLFSGLISCFTLTMMGRNQILEAEILEATNRIKLQEAQAQDEARLKSIGEFASGIAHEINNPLAIIDGYAERLLKEARAKSLTNEKAVRYGIKLSKTVTRATNIVDSLRKISRDGRLVEMQIVSLMPIIETSIGILKEKFRKSGVEVNVLVEDKTYVFCNEVQISQALLNLIGNAFHAVRDLEEKWILVEAVRANSTVQISITDSGNGISEDLQKRIFDPFFTTKDIGLGTGLGLSISKEVVRANGGRLYYDQSSSHTRFVMELMITKEDGPWKDSAVYS
ncbi:MAG: ATP-binding protein [Bdellovibrionota bacterium]|nr:ATP-binding protein [Bdellovibrionota bacterium]